jgi:hypothetical protein
MTAIICTGLDDFKKKHIKPCLDFGWDEPKDIYMIKKEYINDMNIDPAIKRYIDKKIEKLKKELIYTTEESLIRLWDNEYDERWDTC